MNNKHVLENLILLVLVCLPTYLIKFEIFNIPFTVLEILILLLFITFLVLTKFKFILGRYKYIIYSFIIISLIASLYSIDPIKAAGLFKAYIIEPILFFIVIINIKPNFSKVLKALGVSAIFISVIGLVQYIFGWGIPEPWNIRGAEFRITSVYDYPNAVGLFLAPIVALFLGDIIKIKRQKYFSLAVVILSLFSIFASVTEGAFLAVIISFIFLGFFTKYRKFFIASTVLLLLFSFIIPSAREIITFQDTSGDVRLALWQGTANLIKDRPLLGAGLASFPEVYKEYKLDKHVELLLYPHNIFLNFWVEFGALGLLWLIWVLAIFFKTGWQNQKAKTIVLMSAMVAILIYGLVDVPYFKNDLAVLFWTLLALMEISKPFTKA